MAKNVKYYATGRRKTSIARVWVSSGTGKITVNGRTIDDYFPRLTWQADVKEPARITKLLTKIDVLATVKGGGISGQAGAMRHGIARALVQLDENLRTALKSESLLTRDPRMKERKKYGRPGARKRFQFSKR
ncbi:MAG: 30S ribosomal protein S9 [Candidatus Auribacterota bacterium]|uniref:Small ribosomal subunit protein uS9 n=1 Tax=Candidatus Auribacter fodinae TaxID=2093366 RepID=A0A3A4R9E3_9BACT|nr:MAG: 30S ribosomal protein S9 [Candidatus Auribacter fodinae]